MTSAVPTQLPCPVKAQLPNRASAIAIYRHGPATPLTYAELDQAISALNLPQIPSGEALAVILDEPLSLIIWLLACLRQGIIFCPIDPRLTEPEIQQRCRHAGIKYYVSANKFKVAGLTKVSPRVIPEAKPEAIPEAIPEQPKPGIATEPPLHFALNQPATLVFTSGSSGPAKAAQHSLGNHYYSALGSQPLIPFTLNDCWLLSLPLYHIGGIALVFRALFAGGSIALGSRSTDYDLACFPITHASLVPTQVYRLLQHANDLGGLSLRYLLVGGAALTNTLCQQLAEQPFTSFASYGLTEMSSQVATVKITPHTVQPLSYEILPYRQVNIEQQGIMLSGPCLFMGYRQHGRLIAPPLPFNSQDSGRITGQTLQVTGRLDNMFIAGGENVQPEQVEQVLANFAMVKQAIVVPIGDPEFGQVAVAYIDWQANAAPTRLAQLCREQLPPWQRPKHFLAWPKWPGLKPNRKALARQAEQILTNR